MASPVTNVLWIDAGNCAAGDMLLAGCWTRMPTCPWSAPAWSNLDPGEQEHVRGVQPEHGREPAQP